MKAAFYTLWPTSELTLTKPVVWAHLRSPGPGVVLERTPGVLHHPLLAAPLLPWDPC